MEENEEQKQLRENEMKQKEEEIEKFINESYEKEINELNQRNLEIQSKYSNVIETICEWTRMKFEKVVFDSTICSTEINKSTLNKHIANKSNLIFVIDCTYYQFGGYIPSINKDNKKEKNPFIFRLKNNIPIKFDCKQDMRNGEIFHLYDIWNKKLFSFGNEEFGIMKDKQIFCHEDENTVFNYGEADKYIISETWNKKFDRILVIQFSEKSRKDLGNKLYKSSKVKKVHKTGALHSVIAKKKENEEKKEKPEKENDPENK